MALGICSYFCKFLKSPDGASVFINEFKKFPALGIKGLLYTGKIICLYVLKHHYFV